MALNVDGQLLYHAAYTYDAADHLTGVAVNGHPVVTTTYNAVGQPTEVDYANGYHSFYEYDRTTGQLVTLRHLDSNDTEQFRWDITYDAEENPETIASITPLGQETITATYDALLRLTAVTYPTSTVQYKYDALSNRVSEESPSGVITYTYDANGDRIGWSGPDGIFTATYNIHHRQLF